LKSPYLKDQRLADVIAAIQVLSTYKFYKLDFKGWSKRITGSEENFEHWKIVFIEHPEFFRLNHAKDRVSLAWRRSHQRTYHVDRNEILTKEECDSLGEQERNERLSRTPLNNNDIETLINTAINLHTRAIESEKEKRWMLPSLVTIVAVLLGAYLGK
jgi:hypothetical protein